MYNGIYRGPHVIGMDLEWNNEAIDVVGLAFNEGRSATATARTAESMQEFLQTLQRADVIVAHNGIDADLRQLAKEGIDVTHLERKIFDTRLALHATHGHLAGTGSYDLRSMVLLLGGRQGVRFPLDWKQYESDLGRTCAFDAAAALWCYPTLQRLIQSRHLEGVVKTAHAVAPIFSLMREQGVKLDRSVLGQIHNERKMNLERDIKKYGLWEERGVKKVRRIPIWRSPKILDKFEREFGTRPDNLQRSTWSKLGSNPNISPEAREFAKVILELGRGANDAHWLGKATEGEDGLDFSKVSSDGFIHPRYDLCGSPDRAVTSNPNCQNFPRPSEDPRPVPLRSAVIPLDESHSILGVDFSSIETITNAYESHDIDRVMAVLKKEVSHEGTAALLNDTFGLHLTRQEGKAVNHGFDKGECVTPDTLILKADLTWIPAANLKEGEELIGFDEQFHGKKSKYRRAIIQKVSRVIKPCYLVETDKGNMIASDNHAWLVRNFEHVYKWRTTDKLKIGRQLKFFGPPWTTDTSYAAGCLSGFFDGEGCVSNNGISSASLTVNQNAGATLNHYKKLLVSLRYPIRENHKTHKNSKKLHTQISIKSRYGAMRFLGSTRPIRLLSKAYRFWENASVAGGHYEQPATILRISPVGEMETVAIKTSTKTLISNGFLTHNSPWNLATHLFKTERPSRQQVLQCQTIVNRMLQQYPKTSKFRDQLWERSVENPLVVTNSFGRQLQCFSRSKYGDSSERYMKHVPEKKYWCTCQACAPRRGRWKYAIAFLGRSCAFDILLQKMAVLWYDKRLDGYSLPYLECHDELDFSVPTAQVERYAMLAKQCFEEPVAELENLSLPAEAKYGNNWAEAH